MTTSVITPSTRIKVSSVLQKDIKNYGKQFLTDGSEETCWNSDQGLPQFIAVDLGQTVHLHQISLSFQGGFVGIHCNLYKQDDTDDTWVLWNTIYPNDDNSKQNFDFTHNPVTLKRIKLVFTKSSDFYGRVTIYSFDLFGIKCN